MRHRIRLLLTAVLLMAAAGIAAGQELVNVRIYSEPVGARYSVDGQIFYAPNTFLWPRGSKHVITVLTSNFTNESGGTICEEGGNSEQIQYDAQCRIRYHFSGWETNVSGLQSSSLLTQTITVDPGLTFIKAKFAAQYRVDIALVDGPYGGPGPDCMDKANRPVEYRRTGEGVGVVLVGGTCFDYTGHLWLPPGDIPLQAIPLEGYVFLGWHLDGAAPKGPITTYTVRGPAVLAPRFTSAKRVQLETDPVGLKVRVDRAEILTINPRTWVNSTPIPGRYEWAPGSKHVLGGVSPQTDQVETGRMWVFHSWSNGGGQDMIYTADDQVSQLTTLTAKFVPGVAHIFQTEPKGLRLNIEGRENWPVYSFVWGLGSKYTVTAPGEQLDSHGRKWTFKEWKHGGPATQEIVVDDAAIASGGVYYTAIYKSMPRVVVQSSVPGLTLKVDGADCISPCKLDKPLGTQITLSAPETVAVGELTRYELQGWHDGASTERVITVEQDSQTFQANYRKAHRLFAVMEPQEGGAIRCEPASPDGFYPDGASVSLLAEPKPGFKFRRWDGDLTGTVSPGVVTMSASRAVRAMLEKVPYVAPAGVTNAAGVTPVEGVAAGSLITMSGASFTSEYVAGPANPLAQTLGGVVVLLGERLLPLLYVSPEQINALLMSDVQPGTYKLSIRPQAGPEIKAEFNVVRNAPGLLAGQVDSTSYAIALHDDGSPVTVSSPARRGEMLTLLGTGFGPYDRPVVDGFAVPATPTYTLVDTTTVKLGESAIRPEWAGAAPGYTGITSVRFRIPADAGGQMQLRVTVNEAESNTVVLPVE